MLPDASQARGGRRLLKRIMYSQMNVLDAFRIATGKAQPRVPFTVKSDPASVYYNFRISADQREAFIRYINLPADFTVCPIRCLEGEDPDYLLTLNVYEVTGIAVGIRAEWSTYILDDSGTPRYMILEARSSETSMDPVDIITKKSRVDHRTGGGKTETAVASADEALFQARFSVSAETPRAAIHPEWVAANDYIYWRVGICDRTFYDAALAFPKARLIDPAQVTIDDDTHWAPFLEGVPKHVIQYEQAIDFVIMPWFNT